MIFSRKFDTANLYKPKAVNVDTDEQYDAVYKEFAELVNKHCAYHNIGSVLQNIIVNMAIVVCKDNKADAADVLERYYIPDITADIKQLREEHVLEIMPELELKKAH